MTERRLVLLRHAKSSWDDATLPDRERPLAPRGRRAVALLRDHLRATDAHVELVLCSPAERTRATWAGVRSGLRSAPVVQFVSAVYEAEAGDLLDLVHHVDARQSAVMVVGHNPGMAELATALIADGEADALRRLDRGFPTGGLATLSFDGEWADLAWGDARLDSFVRPRDLAGD
jgi:phosphohistidine phosphatase